jgi:hypothetical protein
VPDGVAEGRGVMYWGGYWPAGPEKGFPLAGTESRLPFGMGPTPLQETGREADATGDCTAELKRLGLPVAVENVADVGVVASL